MSPEYKYTLIITEGSTTEARKITNLLERIRGVKIIKRVLSDNETHPNVDHSLSVLDRPMGEVIKAWREFKGLKPSQLAKIAGEPITKDYISKLEHDKIHRAGPRYRPLLAAALEIPEVYLVTHQMPPDGSSI